MVNYLHSNSKNANIDISIKHILAALCGATLTLGATNSFVGARAEAATMYSGSVQYGSIVKLEWAAESDDDTIEFGELNKLVFFHINKLGTFDEYNLLPNALPESSHLFTLELEDKTFTVADFSIRSDGGRFLRSESGSFDADHPDNYLWFWNFEPVFSLDFDGQGVTARDGTNHVLGNRRHSEFGEKELVVVEPGSKEPAAESTPEPSLSLLGFITLGGFMLGSRKKEKA
ncbi:MAG: hypothetical protein AAGJ08_07830 [Cyanobacteria bacterium P01_H01_bin.35]